MSEDRDFSAEMTALIEAELNKPHVVVASQVAAEIVGKLAANDHELLVSWLDIHAEALLAGYIGKRLGSRRAHSRQVFQRGVFAESARRFEAGDEQAMAPWLQTHFEAREGQKRLGSFDHDDLEYARGQYVKRANSNAFEAAFMAALAKQVDTGTVADHYTDEEISRMRGSLRDA